MPASAGMTAGQSGTSKIKSFPRKRESSLRRGRQRRLGESNCKLHSSAVHVE
jgi:hypothetical protein